MSDGSAERPPGFREFMLAMQTMTERASRKLAAVQATTDRWAAQAREAIVPVRDWLATNGPKVIEVMATLQLFAAHAHVENWAGLDEDEWLAALDLVRADDGVPLSWVPPGTVVKALVAAPDHAARDAVLLAHADEIAAGAREVLLAVSHDDLRPLQAAVGEAWDAWDAGLMMPAQAMAALCVSDIVNHHLGFKYFTDFCTDIATLRDEHPEQWGLTAIRVGAVMCSISTAVQHTRHGFPGFNRHATVHRIDLDQYNNANCLRGLMLATSAARELQFMIADEWRTTARFTPPHPGAIRPTPRVDAPSVLPPLHIGQTTPPRSSPKPPLVPRATERP